MSASGAASPFSGDAPDLPQTQQPIPFVPNDIGPDVPHSPGAGSPGNRVILTFQRHLPILHRLSGVPRSSDFAPLLTPLPSPLLPTDLPRHSPTIAEFHPLTRFR